MCLSLQTINCNSEVCNLLSIDIKSFYSLELTTEQHSLPYNNFETAIKTIETMFKYYTRFTFVLVTTCIVKTNGVHMFLYTMRIQFKLIYV